MLKFPSFKIPSNQRVLNALWIFSSLFFWLCIAFWSVLLCLGLALHFLIVPNIDSFRSDIEQTISAKIGTQLKIGQIRAISNSLFPSFEILDITTFNDLGAPMMHINRAWGSLSTQSILRQTLDKLYIEQSDLYIKRKLDGTFEFAGVAIHDNNTLDLADRFFSIRDISITNTQVTWIDEKFKSTPLKINDVSFLIQNGLIDHKFRLDATPPDLVSDRISFRAQFSQPLLSLHPGQWKQWTGQSYFQSERFDLAQVLSLFNFKDFFQISHGSGWLRAWFDLHNGQVSNQLFDFQLKNILTPFFNSTSPLNISSLSGRLKTAPWLTGQEWSTENLSISIQGQNDSWDFSNYRLALSDLNDPFGLKSRGEVDIRNAHLEHLSKFLKNFTPLNQLNETLTTLNIKGKVEKLHGVWGASSLQDQTRILGSAIPKWLENSNQLLNPFSSRNKKDAAISPPNPNPNPAQNHRADHLFQHIKNFHFDGVVSNLERPIALPTLNVNEPTPTNIQHYSKFKSPTSYNQITSSEYFSNFPHFKGLKGSFSFSQSSGSAKLEINDGYFELIGALEQPLIDVRQFATDIEWTFLENELNLKVNNATLENLNAAMTFGFKWRHPQLSHLSYGNLGSIDLNSKIIRLEANTLYKYLPLSVNSSVRNYLKESIGSGLIDKGTIRIKGPLESIPYKNPSQGDFNISARLNHILLNYVPKTLFKSPTFSLIDLPPLSDLQGELTIKGKTLGITSPISSIGFDLNSVQLTKLEAKISDLSDPLLEISGESKGVLSNYLYIFNHSSLSPRLGYPLSQAKSKGNAELKLKLSLPLLQIDKSKVSGTLNFLNNDLFFSSDIPPLSKTRGVLEFTESTMNFQNVQTFLLGGDTKIEGGFNSSYPIQESGLMIKALGIITSEGLEQTCAIDWATKLGSLSKGQTNYSALISIKKSGIPELSITSNLQGLSLLGPNPFNKSADTYLPFNFENTVIKDLNNNHFLERVSLRLGEQVSMGLFKDTGPTQSNILSGSMLIAPNAASMASQFLPSTLLTSSQASSNGWTVSAVLPDLRLDEWQSSVNKLFFSNKSSTCSNPFSDSSSPNKTASQNQPQLYKFNLPTTIKLQSDKINTQGRDFHGVTVLASREGNNWLANVQSKEASGNIKFLLDTEPKFRRISAKLNQFNITPIKNKFNDPLMSDEEPFFPWLDVVIDDLHIKDRSLGHVEFEAHNQLLPKGDRFWLLNNVQLSNADAALKASAQWTSLREANSIGTQSKVDLTLDIFNSGRLLTRLGTPGVVRDGKGTLNGQLTWKGSLINPDFESLNGHFSLDVEKGQFLKTDPGASRLLGVLNLQALPRRLTLDFRDLFGEGFAFDQFKGDIAVKDGTATTQNLVMKGVSGTVKLDGSANIGAETQDMRVVVVPEINAGTASLLYSTVNPLVGLTSFIAQYVIRQPLIQANTRTFRISGSWSDPNVTKIETPVEELK